MLPDTPKSSYNTGYSVAIKLIYKIKDITSLSAEFGFILMPIIKGQNIIFFKNFTR